MRLLSVNKIELLFYNMALEQGNGIDFNFYYQYFIHISNLILTIHLNKNPTPHLTFLYPATATVSSP